MTDGPSEESPAQNGPGDKTFLLKPDEIERLITDQRACLATDRIVVDGEPVGYMYREDSSAEQDSGWRFMAGDETAEYMADANNIGVYALNSLANYDRDIIALLQSPTGSYFAREGPGEPLIAMTSSDDDDAGNNKAADSGNPDHPDLHPDYPVIEGDYRITAEWMVTLPAPCNRRIEDGSMVIWRPGVTLHLVAWDNTPGDSINDRVDHLLASISPEAENLVQSDEEHLTRVSYLINEDVASIATFAVSETSQILASIYFEDKPGREAAEKIAASIRLFEQGLPESTN